MITWNVNEFVNDNPSSNEDYFEFIIEFGICIPNQNINHLISND